MRSHEEALELFNEHTTLAIKIARKFHKLVTDFSYAGIEDAEQVCLAELWRCALNFDDQRGAKFSTYASQCMVGRLQDFQRRLFRMSPGSEVSLDGAPENTNLYAPDLLAPGDLEADTAAGAAADFFLSRLTDRQKQIIQLRESGFTQAEIARLFGVTQVAIRLQIKGIAVKYARTFSCQ